MLSMDFTLLILRVVLGLIFIGHGTQKLFSWFGGRGINATGTFFSKIGFYPGSLWAFVAGLAEALGGLGLALGLFTPIAAAAIASVMLMAIVKVHWSKGFWNTKGGIEFPLLNTVIAAVIGLAGSGAYSLDNLLNISLPMPWTFIVSLAIGVLGILVALGSQSLIEEKGEMRGAES